MRIVTATFDTCTHPVYSDRPPTVGILQIHNSMGPEVCHSRSEPGLLREWPSCRFTIIWTHNCLTVGVHPVYSESLPQYSESGHSANSPYYGPRTVRLSECTPFEPYIILMRPLGWGGVASRGGSTASIVPGPQCQTGWRVFQMWLESRLLFFDVVVAGVVTVLAFHGVGCVHLSSLAVTVLMASGSSLSLIHI